MNKLLAVTCGVIIKEGKILVCQRNIGMLLPLKWEFPGGKIEYGESQEDCLIREIFEELEVQIDIIAPLTPVQHSYTDFGLQLYPYICKYKGGEIQLKEHKQALWVELEELNSFDWAEADLPIVAELMELLSGE